MKLDSKNVLMSIMFMALFIMTSAATSYGACTTITALPATLVSDKNYCLTNNLSTTITTTSAAITISGDNIVLDLAGFQVKNTSTGHGYGIFASGTNKNITVKNGRVNSFYDNIRLEDGDTAGLSNVRVEDINSTGFADDGIRVDGTGIVIKDCQVDGYGQGSHGIMTIGHRVSIIHNDVFGIAGEAIGAHGNSAGGDSSVIRENRVVGTGSAPDPYSSIGIVTGNYTTEMAIINNAVSNFATCIAYGDSSTGKYRDNITMNCTTPYNALTATDAGNNN